MSRASSGAPPDTTKLKTAFAHLANGSLVTSSSVAPSTAPSISTAPSTTTVPSTITAPSTTTAPSITTEPSIVSRRSSRTRHIKVKDRQPPFSETASRISSWTAQTAETMSTHATVSPAPTRAMLSPPSTHSTLSSVSEYTARPAGKSAPAPLQPSAQGAAAYPSPTATPASTPTLAAHPDPTPHTHKPKSKRERAATEPSRYTSVYPTTESYETRAHVTLPTHAEANAGPVPQADPIAAAVAEAERAANAQWSTTVWEHEVRAQKAESELTVALFSVQSLEARVASLEAELETAQTERDTARVSADTLLAALRMHANEIERLGGLVEEAGKRAEDARAQVDKSREQGEMREMGLCGEVARATAVYKDEFERVVAEKEKLAKLVARLGELVKEQVEGAEGQDEDHGEEVSDEDSDEEAGEMTLGKAFLKNFLSRKKPEAPKARPKPSESADAPDKEGTTVESAAAALSMLAASDVPLPSKLQLELLSHENNSLKKEMDELHLDRDQLISRLRAANTVGHVAALEAITPLCDRLHEVIKAWKGICTPCRQATCEAVEVVEEEAKAKYER